MARKSTNNTMNGILNYEENREAAQRKFPHMPVGEAVDMGFDDNGVPLPGHNALWRFAERRT